MYNWGTVIPIVKPNIIIDQHKFLCGVQKETESISHYVVALRLFLSTCDFNCECQNLVANFLLQAEFIKTSKDKNIRDNFWCFLA